jgi:alpha-beta hydrolase superfamily lysophospholipase
MCKAYSTRGWEMKNPNLRVVSLAGADDPCIISKEKFEESVNIIKKVGYKNVASRLYKGMRHEILNEPEFMKVVNDILQKAPVA